MNEQALIIDGVKWYITTNSNNGSREVQPLCPNDCVRLSLEVNDSYLCILKCEECKQQYRLTREFNKQKRYILDKIDSKVFKNFKFINLDDEAIPIAESKVSSKDNKFFTTALLTQSKVGLRLVVYAGEKGQKEKTQIFVEPEIKRLAFDQKDLHPSDVFIKLEGTFNDGTKASIEQAVK